MGRKPKHSNEQLLNLIREKGKELGRTPKSSEIDFLATIIRRFGSYAKALELAGFTPIRRPKNSHDKLSDEEILNIVRNELNALESTSYNVYQKKRKKGPSANYLLKRFKLNGWTELLQLIVIDEEKRWLKTDEYYLDKLKEVHEKLGRVPSAEESYKHGLPKGFFLRRFGTFSNALKLAGIEPVNKSPISVKESKEELKQMYIDFSNKLGYPASKNDLNASPNIYNSHIFILYFGSMYELKKECGFDQGYDRRLFTVEEIKRELTKVYNEFGDSLTCEEFFEKLPFSYTTARHYLKVTSYREILDKIKPDSK